MKGMLFAAGATGMTDQRHVVAKRVAKSTWAAREAALIKFCHRAFGAGDR